MSEPPPWVPADRPPTQGIAEVDEEADGSRFATRTVVASLLALAFVAIAGIAIVRFAPAPAPEIVFTIPLGTGDRIDRGEYIEIVPLNLVMRVGDRMTIVNHDTRQHVVGPFSVRPGETVSYQFSQPGVFRGECTVHTGKDVVMTVA